MLDFVQFAGGAGFEDQGEVVPEEAGLDHDDEEGEDDPVTDGGVEEDVVLVGDCGVGDGVGVGSGIHCDGAASSGHDDDMIGKVCSAY